MLKSQFSIFRELTAIHWLEENVERKKENKQDRQAGRKKKKKKDFFFFLDYCVHKCTGMIEMQEVTESIIS